MPLAPDRVRPGASLPETGHEAPNQGPQGQVEAPSPLGLPRRPSHRRSSQISDSLGAAITITTGLRGCREKVTVALLMAVAAAESGRPTMTFLAKEAVRLAVDGFTRGVACDGCPPLPALLDRKCRGRRPLHRLRAVRERQGIATSTLLANAEVAGTVQLWEWIGDGATTFSF